MLHRAAGRGRCRTHHRGLSGSEARDLPDLQQRLVAYYNAQCCGFAVEYQAYDLSRLGFSPVQQDNRFNFSFTLAGIGTFANFFGALGGTPGAR